MSEAPTRAPRNSGRIFKTCKWGMIQGGTKSILDKFKLCKEVGFDGMELINPLNFGEPEAETTPEQNDAKNGEDQLTMLTCFPPASRDSKSVTAFQSHGASAPVN